MTSFNPVSKHYIFRSFLAFIFATLAPLVAHADPFGYVINSSDDTVSVFDTATNTTVATIPVGARPRDIAISPDGSLVYVGNDGATGLSIIDTATNTVIKTIPNVASIGSVDFSPDGSFAYAGSAGAVIDVINTATNSISTSIPAAVANEIAFTPDGLTAYVASNSATIGILDTSTHTFSSGPNTGTATNEVATTPDGKFAYFAGNASTGTVPVIDTTNNTLVATIPVGSYAVSIELTPDGQFAYTTNRGSANVSVIDTATNTVVSTIPVGLVPRSVAITPDSALAYVTNFGSNDVSVIDTATQTVIATLPATNGPDFVAISPNGQFAYIVQLSSTNVLVIDTTTNTIVGTVTVGNGATKIVFSPEAVNAPPASNAGLDQAIRAGELVNLDGSASFDDNTASADLTYAWTITALPGGSAAVLSDAASQTPSFTADIAGTYEVSLTVTDDGGLSSDADTVEISSDNLAPTANAGDNQLVIVGANVGLDGSASTDPENDTLTFAWTLTGPAGSAAALNDATLVSPSFTPDIEGLYTADLSVSDFLGAGSPDSVEITATLETTVAEDKIMDAEAVIAGLSGSQVTTQGNQNALTNFLGQAVIAIQIGDIDEAINKLTKAIARTDGCALRGSPDTKGKGRDWITDCGAQAPIYSALNEALDTLTP